jgi:hypothetical protein
MKSPSISESIKTTRRWRRFGVYDVLTQLGLERNEKTVAGVQQAIDLHLLRADSWDDPGMICVSYDGIRLAEKR